MLATHPQRIKGGMPARLRNMAGKLILKLPDAIAGTDGDQLVLWMDNYCREHPLETVATGVNGLYDALAAKKETK
jgi:hypothetical protein